MSLPFELDFCIGAFDASYPLDITLVARSDALVDADSLAASAEVIALIPPAANLQLLGSRDAPASAQIGTQRLSPDGRRWTFRLVVSHVPATSYALVVALLAQTTFAGDPLAKVVMRAAGGGPPMNAQWLLAAVADGLVLPRKGRPPFQVVFEQPQRHQRLVTLQFASALGQDTVELYEQAMTVWDRLVGFGGFELTFDEQEGFDPSMGSYFQPEPTVLEHRFFCDGDDAAAFRSLLGLLEYLHPRGPSLTRVRIA